MAGREQLPNWKAQSATTIDSDPGQPYARVSKPPPQRRRWPLVLFGLLGLAALIGLGTLGYYLGTLNRDDGNAVANPQGATTSSTAESTSTEDDSDKNTDENATTDADSDDAVTITVAPDETTTTEPEETDESAEGDESDSGRTAVMRGGVLYLGGAVPSEEIADAIVAKAVAVMGEERVVENYTIDPSVEIRAGDSTPLIVEDVVLFGFNSVEVAPDFLPLLDIGAALLAQNPQATLTVVTRTDAAGTEEVNLDIAERRGESVVDYITGKGAPSSQILVDARGEEGASDDDDEETAALNRRAEFIITGLLD